MILDQKQKQFWNRHAKRNNNPRDANVSVLLGAFVSRSIGYARTCKLNQPSGFHFNLPGHSIHNMKFTIIEKVKSNDPIYRRERERFHIEKFDTFHFGLNKKP